MNKYIGWIIFGTLVFYLVSVLIPILLIVPTLLAWVVVAMTWRKSGRNTRNLALALLLFGFILMFVGANQGIFPNWKQIFATNIPLLSMFVAVSFLTLTNPSVEKYPLPKGTEAAVRTALGTHLLGAVINLSVLYVFGDRLQKNGALDRAQMIILARSFCAAAWWSPFFVATGVALTYAPEMSWKKTLIPGVIMSVSAISYSIIEVSYFRKTEFSGYPIKSESLRVPAFLAVLVICVDHIWHNVNILVIICLLSLGGMLVFVKDRPRLTAVHEFIENRLVTVSSQFLLFLTTGVFSAGINSIIYLYPEMFITENSSLTPWLFAMISGMMIIIGFVGVHPVVSIAIVSSLLIPLKLDHSQLGFLFLTTWAISTGSSPLSGVGLALISKYQASFRIIIQSNWHYVIVMWAISCAVNVFFFPS